MEPLEVEAGNPSGRRPSEAKRSFLCRLNLDAAKLRDEQEAACQRQKQVRSNMLLEGTFDEDRPLDPGERTVLNLWYCVAVAYIRSLREYASQVSKFQLALSSLLTGATLFCSASAQIDIVPGWMVMVVSLCAVILNAIINYLQLPMLEIRLLSARDRWLNLRDRAKSFFRTHNVRNPSDAIYRFRELLTEVDARTPQLPRRLQRRIKSMTVTTLQPDYDVSSIVDSIGASTRVRDGILTLSQIQKMLKELTVLQIIRQDMSEKSKCFANIGFAIGLASSVALVLNTAAAFELAHASFNDHERNKTFVSMSSGLVSVLNTLRQALQPGKRAQEYSDFSQQAVDLRREVEVLLYCAPHAELSRKYDEIRCSVDALCGSMSKSGIDVLDSDMDEVGFEGIALQRLHKDGSNSTHCCCFGAFFSPDEHSSAGGSIAGVSRVSGVSLNSDVGDLTNLESNEINRERGRLVDCIAGKYSWIEDLGRGLNTFIFTAAENSGRAVALKFSRLRGSMGIVCDTDGIAEAVFDNKQAHAVGIQKLDKILYIDYMPYSQDSLQSAENSGLDYVVIILARAIQVDWCDANLIPIYERRDNESDIELDKTCVEGEWHYYWNDDFCILTSEGNSIFAEYCTPTQDLIGFARTFTGTLTKEGDWYSGEMYEGVRLVGFFRLQRASFYNIITSNFRESWGDTWGEDRTAIRRQKKAFHFGDKVKSLIARAYWKPRPLNVGDTGIIVAVGAGKYNIQFDGLEGWLRPQNIQLISKAASMLAVGVPVYAWEDVPTRGTTIPKGATGKVVRINGGAAQIDGDFGCEYFQSEDWHKLRIQAPTLINCDVGANMNEISIDANSATRAKSGRATDPLEVSLYDLPDADTGFTWDELRTAEGAEVFTQAV